MTTFDGKRADVMTQSWHTMMEFNPPLIGCVIGGQSYTFDVLKKTGECVINIPTAELMRQVVACGNASGRKTDKFKKCRLTAGKAERVDAPLIDECFASIECRVKDAGMINKYGFFVLEAVKAWVDPQKKAPKTLHHMGMGKFMVAGKTIQTKSKAK